MSASDARTGQPLRSEKWFGAQTLRGLGQRSRLRQLGIDPATIKGRPLIAIINTGSDINPCHAHFRDRCEQVKQGVLEAGGVPFDVPAMSLAEAFQRPTSMLYRNLLAIEVEEQLWSYPFDGCVVLAGCDKTVPGTVMGAINANLPLVVVPAGAMLAAPSHDAMLGSGTAVWHAWDEARAGRITSEELAELERSVAPTVGTCNTMGTASTMTAVVDALGLCLTGASSIPAPFAAHAAMARASGAACVALVREGLSPDRIVDGRSMHNALRVLMALGGSTNAVIHLMALSARCGTPLTLGDFDRVSRTTPLLADIQPNGKFLMEHFYAAGGLPALLHVLGDLIDGDAQTVARRRLGEVIAHATVKDPRVIRTLAEPLRPDGSLAVLTGNLAPDGAILKQSAASTELLDHTGPAVVFDGIDDMRRRINSPDLPVRDTSVLVLRHAGPVGAPGMPEWGMLPIPDRLLRQGVRDMVRISDARMSGTSYGTCVLHVAPEAAVGGPLARLRDGDLVHLNAAGRRLDALVADDDWDGRKPTLPKTQRLSGYMRLFTGLIQQADKGCDFEGFSRVGPRPDPLIY